MTASAHGKRGAERVKLSRLVTFAIRAFAVATTLSLLASAPLVAQIPTTADTLATATLLRDRGDFAGGAALLRTYLARHPDHGDAARLLSETLYWLKDFDGARAVAEASLLRHPEDTSLRVQYGRMLMEMGDRARAREALRPALASDASGRAATLIGTMAYWDGDLAAASHSFDAALRTDPASSEARRQLDEIRALTAPWLRVVGTVQHDDQPITTLSPLVEVGMFADPGTSVTLRAQPMSFRLSDTATRTIATAEVGLTHFFPTLHTDFELTGGGIRRSFGSTTDWTGRAGIGVHLARGLIFRVRGERAPYLYTEASLSTPVMTTSGAAILDLNDPSGWLGRAAYQRQRYPDGNTIRTAYAWLLLPVIHKANHTLQVGYAVASQNAAESRFQLLNPTQPYPPTDPRFDLQGHYAAYYTPSQLLSHSASAAGSVRVSGTVTLRANGSYAIHAREDSPSLVVAPAAPPRPATVQLTSARRSFSPWNAGAALEIASGNGLTVLANGEISRTAFYQTASAGLGLTYRFGRPARRAAIGN